jgi:signal peptidase II
MSQTETPQTTSSDQIIAQPNAAEKQRLSYYWPFGLALVWVVFDQITKNLVEAANLEPWGVNPPIELLGGQVKIVYLVNRGASFSFLNNADVPWIFALLAIAASLGLSAWYIWRGTRNPWLQVGFGLILGGIVGNLVDRIFRNGGVTDIITMPNIGIFKVFNVADSGITIGMVIIIATILLQSWSESRRSKTASAATPTDNSIEK